MNRRNFLMLAAGLVLWARQGRAMTLFGDKKQQVEESFPFLLTDTEWKSRLSPDAYRVLRQHGTEPAFTSPLNDEKRAGIFKCGGCGEKLFLSEHKFDSGTGWPSFWQAVSADAVGTATDYKIGVGRTEIHCSNCGGHLGHVFDDGPAPTGKRYCTNGVALHFQPQNP